MKCKMTDEEAKVICDTIRQTAYAIHLYLGVGCLPYCVANYFSLFVCHLALHFFVSFVFFVAKITS